MNIYDLNNSELPPEELSAYREALAAAYPHPKKNIKAGVMAEILSAKPVAKKKKSSAASRILRWGSLAACILLVGTVCLRMLPAIEKSYSTMEADHFFSSNAMDDGAVLHDSALDLDANEADNSPTKPSYEAVYEASMENATELRTSASTGASPEASAEAKTEATAGADMVEGEASHASGKEMTAAEDSICDDGEHFDAGMHEYAYGDRACRGLGGYVWRAGEEIAFAP